jgi:hypothetical protein
MQRRRKCGRRARLTHDFAVLGDGARHQIEKTKSLRANVLELTG